MTQAAGVARVDAGADEAAARAVPARRAWSRDRRAAAAVAAVAAVATVVTVVGLAGWWVVAGEDGRPTRGRVAGSASTASASGSARVATGTVAQAGQADGATQAADGAGQATPAGPATAAAMACGSAMPIPLHLPAGYSGPEPGPGFGGPVAQRPGQLVVHYSGRTGGDIEARWPSGYAAAPEIVTTGLGFLGPLDGTPDVVATARVPGATGACQHLQLAFDGPVPAPFGDRITSVFRPGGSEADREFRALLALVTAPGDNGLVAGSRTVDELPAHARGCSGARVPNRAGTTVTVPAGDPETALEDFLAPAGGADPPVSAGIGYLKFIDPAGRVAFALPFSGGPGYVVLVRMTHRSTGWVVGSWETSGC